jgi:hypothetical protein
MHGRGYDFMKVKKLVQELISGDTFSLQEVMWPRGISVSCCMIRTYRTSSFTVFIGRRAALLTCRLCISRIIA